MIHQPFALAGCSLPAIAEGCGVANDQYQNNDNNKQQTKTANDNSTKSKQRMPYR